MHDESPIVTIKQEGNKLIKRKVSKSTGVVEVLESK